MKRANDIGQKQENHTPQSHRDRSPILGEQLRWVFVALIGLMVLMGLVACSSDDGASEEHYQEVRLMPYYQPFSEKEEVEEVNSRRDPALPDGYSPYIPIANSPYAKIRAYFTLSNSGTDDNDVNYGVFTYKNDGWVANAKIEAGKTYYVYGFMPTSAPSGGASLSKISDKNYDEGAVLTLNGLDVVSPADVCVVVGAKGFDIKNTEANSLSYATGEVEVGKFNYTAGGEENNYIYLLLDHIYACLDLQFQVNADYAKLRTIKLKRVEMAAASNATKVNLVITFNQQTGEEGCPPVYQVAVPTETSSQSSTAILHNVETPIPTEGDTPLDVPGYFTPNLSLSNFTITSYYDVYDRKGNLVRSNCQATNKISIGTLARGKKQTVTLTVNPTYLYQLSDPDLDNPTIVVTGS